jgi:hypothetical protein
MVVLTDYILDRRIDNVRSVVLFFVVIDNVTLALICMYHRDCKKPIVC